MKQRPQRAVEGKDRQRAQLAPLWDAAARVGFGPRPRHYRGSVVTPTRRLARRSALSRVANAMPRRIANSK